MSILSHTRKFAYALRNDGLPTALGKTLDVCAQKMLFLAARMRWKNNMCRRVSLLRQGYPPDDDFEAWKRDVRNFVNASFDIPAGRILAGAGIDFSGAEVVLVAHWDPQRVVDPYVRQMCRHFRLLGKRVVLCSAEEPVGVSAEPDWADAVLHRTCPGYDFTSWKAAFALFPTLFQSREVTLCNDSVFAPVGSYAPVYAAMERMTCDFWGMVYSDERRPHLQSFHLVLRENTLRHQAFRQFLDATPGDANRMRAIGLEFRFGAWLELHGLRPAAYFSLGNDVNESHTIYGKTSRCNPSLHFWRILLQHGCPVFKRALLKATTKDLMPFDWWSELAGRGYDMSLITAYFHRVGIDISGIVCSGERQRECPPNIFLRQRAVDIAAGGSFKGSLAVITHCYYTDIFRELFEYLHNVPDRADVYVSTDNEEKADFIREYGKNAGFASWTVRVFPNRGWDIAPFIAGFRDAIAAHDLILKIHAKKSTSVDTSHGDMWRRMLFSSLAGSREHVDGILGLFGRDAELGILAPPTALHCIPEVKGGNMGNLIPLLRKMDFYLEQDDAIDLPAGSMFWTRGRALSPLLGLGLTFDDFEETDAIKRNGSLAHAIERAFFYSACRAGYYWGRVPPTPYTKLAPPAGAG